VSAPLTIERDGGVAVIVLDHPPVNALAHRLRTALLTAIERLDSDPTVQAIVLHGAGRNFIAGADISEFDQPAQPPLLNELLFRLESCGKPVVAALHGAALGGGAETALACHYRAATSDLKIGFPEVTLGLLPGAGGTVRLPRVAGWKVSLEMMTGGKPVDLDRATAMGLIDHRIEGDVRAGAVAWARELVAGDAQPRRLRDLAAPEATPELFNEWRAAMPAAARRLPAPGRIVDALEASATRPFDQALDRARELFEECRRSSESRALRYLFFAERGSSADRDAALPVESAGVIGAGTMGAGVAISLATAGIAVTLVDSKPESLAAGLARVTSTIEGSARKGRMTAADAAAAVARVRGSGELKDLSAADLVIEAAFENLAVKRGLFAELGKICRPQAVLTTNTSTLDVDAIAAASGRATDVAGMHFFSPANIMRLVEIVRGRESSRVTLATIRAVTRRIGKIGVTVGNCYGFVGNRMLYAYGREKELMLLEGSTPEAIDRALEGFGMAMGPNAVGDLAGLDIGFHARREWSDRPDDPRFYRVSDRLAELGRYGQKADCGFYRYDGPDRKRQPDPEVVELIRTEAKALGVAQRKIADTEIVERCIYALVNEGARVLEEGIAASPADIDVIWCNGYGFPRHRGGPMFHADCVGLATVIEAMRRYEGEQGARYWTPAPLLASLAEREGTFAGWQAGRAGVA
jgi:3-hydroxyacyl-CoA dehydrogenase